MGHPAVRVHGAVPGDLSLTKLWDGNQHCNVLPRDTPTSAQETTNVCGGLAILWTKTEKF
eukprot:5936840-Amphidinium_carterae.1